MQEEEFRRNCELRAKDEPVTNQQAIEALDHIVKNPRRDAEDTRTLNQAVSVLENFIYIHAGTDERINKMLHRSDCQNHDTDDCFGCKLAECYESIRELISELKFNPQRDDEDKQQIDSVIEKAKRKLPEFRGMRFGNHYIGGRK